MQRSFDEAKFFEATGLDLQRLISRHIGKDSEQQIFEWIALVLGKEYFIGAGGSVYIHTLKGWHQHLLDSGLYQHFRDVKAGVTDTIEDAQ